MGCLIIEEQKNLLETGMKTLELGIENFWFHISFDFRRILMSNSFFRIASKILTNIVNCRGIHGFSSRKKIPFF